MESKQNLNNFMSNKSILKIFGNDAKTLLQRMITNDIEQSESFYSLILSPIGKYLFDFFVTNKDMSYYIEIDKNKVDEFTNKLNQVKFRQDIKIENLSDIFAFIYTNQPLANSFISYKDPRYIELGYRNIVIKTEETNDDLDLYLQDKFNYSIPDGTYDLIYNKSIPHEFGLDSLGAINFRKGCYVGQEVVSRIRTQGVVRKKIFKVISNQDLGCLQNLDIFYEEKKIGILTSSLKKLGIAQIFLFDDFDINMDFYVENIPISLSKVRWYTK
jgi:folate-binding protein YgfZ